MTPAPIINVDGIDNINGVFPPDTEGDVGIDYYMQWVNLSVAVYNKSDGSLAWGPFNGNVFWSGLGGGCESTNQGDPIVLFDHLAQRWLVSQFFISGGTQCVAVSTTSDPTGSYHRYAFQVTPGGQNDYPKLGVGVDSYWLTTRDFPVGSTFNSAIALEKNQMLQGLAATFIKFSITCVGGDCAEGVMPPHLEGPLTTSAPTGGAIPGTFFAAWDDDSEGPLPAAGGSDGIRSFTLTPDWVTPGNSTFVENLFIPSSEFSRVCFKFCVDQPAGGSLLDALDGFSMYRAQIRDWGTYQTAVFNTSVDTDPSGGRLYGIRWFELRNSGAGWTLFQEGTYAPGDGNNRWMGSVAMDGAGNIALGYSVSSSTTFPSIRYTSRQASDPLGTMPGGEVEAIAGSGVQSGGERWGDYSTMSVDPVDNCTFWYTTEYIQTTGGAPWRTRIVSFKLDSCQGDAIFADGFESGDTSAWSISVP
jgi:hypothetical protein